MLDELIKLSRHFLTIKNRPYQRYFLQTIPLEQRCMIILGQRGVGKTTTLIQYLLQYSNGDIFDSRILYIQTDHFLVGTHTLYEIASTFDSLGGKILALDEIHKYANWSKELKSIYDTFPDLTIIASGSSALEIHRGSHDLSRRALIYRLYGLSLREYIALCCDIKLPTYSLEQIINEHEEIATIIIDKLNNVEKKIIQLFLNYLDSGYYPYFIELNNTASFWMTLEQNIHTTLEADLIAIHPELNGTSLKKIRQLLAFIANSVPFTPNWTKIKSIIEVSDNRTLKTYFKYLEDACLIKSITVYSKQMNKMVAGEKVYLDNTNQIQAITGGDGNRGNIRETFFIDMLKVDHEIHLPAHGDFIINGKYTFEIGGKNKDFKQIKSVKDAYLACDNVEMGIANKIPLWLFGFLY